MTEDEEMGYGGREALARNMTCVVTFDCLHVVEFKHPFPVVGQELWCVRCHKYMRVKDAPMSLKLRCRSCRYTRTFGASRLDAECKGAKHALLKGHRVELRDGYRLVYEWTPERAGQLALDDVPPF